MREIFRLKIWKTSLAIVSAAVLVGSAVVFYELKKEIKISQAGAGHNVLGFAWSENIDWISFNSGNCDTDSNGFVDTDATVLGCGGDNSTDVAFDYGVNVDSVTGNFSGYAWSSSIGWVRFQQSAVPEVPPDNFAFSVNCDDPITCDDIGDNCTACYNSTDHNIYGWAKILALGDDGWLKMNGTWSDGVNLSNNDFSDWAWNDDNNNTGIGWVSFNCDNNASCGVSDYKVYLRNNPPVITSGGQSMVDVCLLGANPQAQFFWGYTDIDIGDFQSAYQVEIYKDAAFTLPVVGGDSGKVLSASNVFTVPAGVLEYSKEYWYRLRVWDSNNAESNILTPNFNDLKSISHQYPTPAFSYDPSVGITQFQEITFDPSLSQAYGGFSILSYEWDFDYDVADPLEPSLDDSTDPGDPTTVHSYAEVKTYEVNLKVTDTSMDSYSCMVSQSIDVGGADLPKWNEANP